MRMKRLSLLLGAALLAALAPASRLSAQDVDLMIPAGETRDPPTPERLRVIEAEAASVGWPALINPLRTAAVGAYIQGRYIAADAWFHAYGWAALFSESESRFADSWVAGARAAGVNYEGFDAYNHPGEGAIGANMSTEMQNWVLEHDSFSQEFFSDLNTLDFLPRVLAILDGLHKRSPERFERYSSLALALALVYDVPPPPYWPHYQVSARSLPRRLANPAEPFDWLIREDALGHTFQRLSRLRADELKYVVDFAAPVQELQWSVANVHFPLDQIEQDYFMVHYRMDRFSNQAAMTWNTGPYTLPAILAQGGICVDQAYFATEAGKARGVPTLLFAGQGQDGRHAWFGYLDGAGQWKLDAGRYAEQRLVTGVALDPQTWQPISDHELQFLSERFRALPSYAQSRVHAEFAHDFLQAGRADLAAKAARQAVNYERRNVMGWETLVDAEGRLHAPPAVVEGILKEAALAFTPKYPDLVRYFENRVVQSLRARGERSLADYEERGIAERMKADRSDLAIGQAASILSRSLASDPVPNQIATYNAILVQFGHGAGTQFFDEIVVGFAEHLAGLNLKEQAREAVSRAREALDVQPGTQIAGDMDKLLARLHD